LEGAQLLCAFFLSSANWFLPGKLLYWIAKRDAGKKETMRHLNHALLLIAIIMICTAGTGCSTPGSLRGTDAVDITSESGNDSLLADAFIEKANNREVQGQGIVVKLLADDSEGARHQRFILQLNSGQTVLIAHNIDIAPRISPIHLGDFVQFKGEYEWNAEGGIIHWTHHDPLGKHESGWIKLNDRFYQ
jgi:hypothetical protein